MINPPAETENCEQSLHPNGRTPVESIHEPVLVVGRSRVNLVVVSKIVHRCGLKAATVSIEDAAGHLMTRRPGLVVLDGGADNRDCDVLFAHIATYRRASEAGLPRVIMLCTRNGTIDSLPLPSLVDEVVSKPITPERLQPVIDRLARRQA
ncbi:response regulator [Arvimicrobium flavum]|uniref:response regulator n=1 Tax=Arvimicrobium flavum TaxID=3393320 RepID=UPI00237AB4E2|nr:response regulator [Mesorhizobium shangrilense]